MTQLLITVGVGGVGKTTTAAALGVWHAQQGHKTLVITIDPARRLAQNLGLNPRISIPQKTLIPNLEGMVLDVKETFDRLLKKCAIQEHVLERIHNSSVYEPLTQTLVGMQEYMALEALYEHVTSKAYDVVVLDTPPSKHVVEFFEAPVRMAHFFGGGAARWFVRFAKSTRFVVKGFEMLTGGAFLTELVSFFSDMEVFFDGFAERAGKVQELLRDKNCEIFFVTTPLRAFYAETESLKSRIRDSGLSDTCTVMNRVPPDFAETKLPSAEMAKWFATQKQCDVKMDQWKEACQFLRRRCMQQRSLALSSSNAITLEQTEYEVSTLDGLRRLADQWGVHLGGSRKRH